MAEATGLAGKSPAGCSQRKEIPLCLQLQFREAIAF
jgi:hypothetical protein